MICAQLAEVQQLVDTQSTQVVKHLYSTFEHSLAAMAAWKALGSAMQELRCEGSDSSSIVADRSFNSSTLNDLGFFAAGFTCVRHQQLVKEPGKLGRWHNSS